MVAADSDSGSESKYSEPKFSDSDDDMGHVQPPLQNVQSSRDIVDNFVRRGRGRGRGTRAKQRARGQRGHGRRRHIANVAELCQKRLTLLYFWRGDENLIDSAYRQLQSTRSNLCSHNVKKFAARSKNCAMLPEIDQRNLAAFLQSITCSYCVRNWRLSFKNAKTFC